MKNNFTELSTELNLVEKMLVKTDNSELINEIEILKEMLKSRKINKYTNELTNELKEIKKILKLIEEKNEQFTARKQLSLFRNEWND